MNKNIYEVIGHMLLLNCIHLHCDVLYHNMQDTNRSKCTAKIYGGTFVGFNPADNTAEGTGTNFVADGYKSVETTYNGKQAWKVVKE